MPHELTVNPNEQTNFSDDIMKRASRGSLTMNSESPNMYSANSHDVAALTQAASMRLASEAMRASAESLTESTKRMLSQESVGTGKQAASESKIEEEVDEVLSKSAPTTEEPAKLTLARNMSTKPATPSELTHHEDFDDDDEDSDESKTHSSSPAPPTA